MLLTNQSLKLKEHSKKTGDFQKNKAFQIFLASVLRQEFSRDRQVYRYSSEAFINTQQSYNHQMSEQKLKYEKINQVFRRECLVLEKEQSKESLTQLCQQVQPICVLINTTNNNDSPVKIETDITYVHHQCII
ncbi:unnamed protein product [Rotaria sordida]|uniref:Uncharacterized protein n=1 Tax=Rotaria sordida TaxID=392033 RepID=A0A819JH19_9BILA|nr:unnamed protein product [Rotaria sordida]